MRAPVDPGRDEAARWLQDELSRPEYAVRESWVRRAVEWVGDRLPDLDLPGQLPAWASWVALALVLVAVLAVLAFAARDRWRRRRLVTGTDGRGVFGEGARLTGAAYRDRARTALRAGEHDAALLDAYRAIAATAAERVLLDAAPGRTAHEVAVGLTSVFPSHAGELARAADAFDAVRYGDHHADETRARAVLTLDEQLATARPAPHEMVR